MNIGLHHFRLVDTISREGTLTKSASALHLTQSALSHQLKELEREMDVQVFERKGKKMQLTEKGTRFLQSAEKILAEIKSLEEDIQNSKNGNMGKINFSTQAYTAYHWLPDIIKNYRIGSPNMNVHIVSEATKRPLEFLLRGDLDVALVRTQMMNKLIHYEHVFEDELMVVLSKNHPLAQKNFIEIKDFEGTELILPAFDSTYQATPFFESLIQKQHVTPRNLHRIHYTDATIEMVNADLGITVMADWIIKPYLANKAIVAKPFAPGLNKLSWYAATCSQGPAVQNFVKCLKEYFANQPQNLSRNSAGVSMGMN